MSAHRHPPGHPGLAPRWTSSAKEGVGTAVEPESRVWFSLSHGIVNEVYHPFIDHATIRDCGLLVANGRDFFSEEKRDTTHEIRPLEQGVPGYCVRNTCRRGRYRITKTVVTDPSRDVLVQRIRFEALQGELRDYLLCVLLAPHIGNQGMGNHGWAGTYRGIPMLFAERDGTVLALACSTPWTQRSCGFVGTSDGWQDLHAHCRLEWEYPDARDGNIALTGAVDLSACDGEFTIAVGFGRTHYEAGQQVRATLLCGADDVILRYVGGWQSYQQRCRALPSQEKDGFDLYRVSTAVLKTHESKRFAGGLIASLSIPWGYAQGDQDLGGYHVVWPRDQVEAAGAMLAVGHPAAARQTLFYLMCTQDADGHWPQNMWLDGKPYWSGRQADETAFPILLADALRRRDELAGLEIWPMVRLAARFIVRTGPVTKEDRWEENAGYPVFTLAVEIAAMLAAADCADLAGAPAEADFLRETADCWHAQLDAWTYVRDTELARHAGVDGYYVRMAPPDLLAHASLEQCTVKIPNHPGGSRAYPASDIVSIDALALVRFGLRAADDPRILNTVKVIDAELKTETSTGPVWHRYSHDGYGESAAGEAFLKSGIGRGWPLLAGERAHYELAAGHRAEAEHLWRVMAAQTSAGALLPEQVWDAEDLPARGLRNGHPSGSAMPLMWAHAEYLKLSRSLHDGAVFDTPPQPVERYVKRKTSSPFVIWRCNHQVQHLPPEKILRVEMLAPACVRWTRDHWQTYEELETRERAFGLHVADLPTAALASGTALCFTLRWLETGEWEQENFAVCIH